MTKIKEVEGFEGIIQLETSKNVKELRNDKSVILIEDTGDSIKVLVDISDYVDNKVRYIH